MENQAAMLRAIAQHAGLPALRELAGRAGVQAAYRVTVHYFDRRARDSVGTAEFSRVSGARLTVVFLGALGHRPLQHPLAPSRYEALVRALQMLRFDNLSDQPDIPLHGVDLWMVERAAGGFVKSVILAPALARGTYALLIDTIKEYLPTALKLVV
ncbi:MAG: hypothetical protein HXY40_03350 [Chloroflexi bacterium]|nr:hypothetical protein [Chloroflexota bacterium]